MLSWESIFRSNKRIRVKFAHIIVYFYMHFCIFFFSYTVEDLVTGSVAIKAYQEAPFQRKATLFLSNIVFVGPLGSGKTSLLRTFTGKTFRLIEPPSHHISFSGSYHDLADWLPVVGGLVYEDELCKVIVEDLLKHIHSMLTSPSKLTAPVLGPGRGISGISSSSSTIEGGACMGGESPPPPPPPLPPPRLRSLSFSDSHQNRIEDLSVESTKASKRLSGSFEVIESGSPEGKLQLGVRPHPFAGKAVNSSRRQHPSRQGSSFITKLITPRLRRSFRVKGSNIRRHHSDSVKTNQLTVSDDHAIPYRKPANGSIPLASNYQSSCPLPEQLIEKIKKELEQSTDGTLNQKYYGRMVDIPGGGAFQVFKHLFITDSSVCVLTFDISKDILSAPSPGPRRRSPLGVKDTGIRPNSENSLLGSNRLGFQGQPWKGSYLSQLMTTIGDICLQWSHSNADLTVRGARIILVGTHSDKVPSSVSHKNFDLLRKAVKGSPYEKYVSMVKFVVSSSSIIERSSIEDLKHFIMDIAKKACRVQVPLKWLRCVRRFQAFSAKKAYIMSLAEAKKIIEEVCDISQPEEIEGVLQFLHHNHIILYFERIHQLKQIVITDCKWFASHLSAVFKAGYVNLTQKGAPPELHSDQELLRLRGILTDQLLDFLWRDKESQKHKEELLTLMSKMDILCCMASETNPFSLATSIEDLTQDSSLKRKKGNMSKGMLSSVIVPSLVEESAPPHLASLPTFMAEPVVFRFKEGHVPSSLFQRLLVRCVQSYPNSYTLYRDAATFEVDLVSLLMLTTGKDFIRVSLHCVRNENEPHSPTIKVTDLDSLMSPKFRSPCPDVCMAVLMFIQATISDLIQQWMPNLSYDLCVLCSCRSQVEREVDVDHARKLSIMSEPGIDHRGDTADAATMTSTNGTCNSVLSAWGHKDESHYIVLSDMDNVLQHSFVRCEAGNQMPLTSSLLCWFGEAPRSPSIKSPTSPRDDSGEIKFLKL